MPEPPLSDHELRVVRGMLDEYERHRIVRMYIAQAQRIFRLWVVVIIAAVALIFQALWHGR